MEPLRIVDLCYLHEQLLKIQTPSARVNACIGTAQDLICRTVEGLRSPEKIAQAIRRMEEDA